MSKQRYIVVNSHWGDKGGKRHRYAKGETRMIDPDNPEPDVKGHLQFGNLAPEDGKEPPKTDTKA